MVITPHILAGAAVGLKVDNYWSAAILAVASHYLLDLIPHKEYDDGIKLKEVSRKKMVGHFFKIAADFFIGVSLIFLFDREFYHSPSVLIGMFFGIAPDFLSYLRLVVKADFLEKHLQFHKLLHFWKNENISDWIKICSQVSVALIAIWVIS